MSSQSYQTQLLDYRRKVHPEESGQLPECFVDLESQDLLVAGAPQFDGSNYENGIKVVSGRSCANCITTVVYVHLCVVTRCLISGESSASRAGFGDYI